MEVKDFVSHHILNVFKSRDDVLLVVSLCEHVLYLLLSGMRLIGR